ncbi:MAG: LuxR family transcriptional regulator, partial [Phycisphaerales bacterium]|nr:LuxR family transcriptional regulator [Phycisphaerales bacterium]
MDADNPDIELLLTETEVRQVVRLLAEALTPDDGRPAKVRRLMEGLCTLTNADAWFWVRSRVNRSGGPPVNIDFLYGGLGERELAIWAERSLEVRGVPPEHVKMYELLAQGRHFTVARQECVTDDVWHVGESAEYIKKLGFDEFMYSWLPLPESTGDHLLSGCCLLRRPDKPRFDRRAGRIAHLMFAESHPLHTDDLNVTLVDQLSPLSPRCRQVLALLLDGSSVKQAAQRME